MLQFHVRIFVVLSLLIIAPSAQDWVLRKDGRPMTGMVASDNKLVVFGKGAGLWVKDGKSWSTARVPGNKTIIDMVWTGTMFAGITQLGSIVHSTDGLNWSVRDSVLSSHAWNRILWVNDSFTVVGKYLDRIARVSASFGSLERDTRRSLAIKQLFMDETGKAAYMLWSSNGKDTLSKSVDGSYWPKLPYTDLHLEWLQKFGDGWVGIRSDTLFGSKDLLTWSPISRVVDSSGEEIYLDRLHVLNGRLLGTRGNSNMILESVDGTVWRKAWEFKGNIQAEGIALQTNASGTYFLVADDILLALDSAGGWKIERDHMVNYLQGVAYKNNAIQVYGFYFAQLESKDGVDWTIKRGLHEFAPMGWSAVADFGEKLFPLGQTLSMLPTADTNVMIDQMPKCGWTGGGRRVIVGLDGMLAVSNDGKVWQDLRIDSTTDLRSGFWHDGLHVVVGDTILTSPDGLTWTGRARPAKVALSTVAWGAGRWVAFGGGSLLVSDDGFSWSIADKNVYSVTTVRYAAGQFMAVGSAGRAYMSKDGIDWVPMSIGADVELDDVAWTGAGWVAVGQYGIIATLGDPVVPTPVGAQEHTPLYLPARWNGRFLSTPSGTVSVDLIDTRGRMRAYRPGVDGRVDLRALPQGFWIARGTGERPWTLRLVR